ncbi:hypothetical protein JW906_11025 [bacterium]|nr:hypothetical protein [bacterium]
MNIIAVLLGIGAGVALPVWTGLKIKKKGHEKWARAVFIAIPFGLALLMSFIAWIAIQPRPLPGMSTGMGAGGTFWSTEKKCGNCGRPVLYTARAGEKCPHCGVIWSFERNIQK